MNPDRFTLIPLDYSHCTVDADRCLQYKTCRRWLSYLWRTGGDAERAGDRIVVFTPDPENCEFYLPIKETPENE